MGERSRGGVERSWGGVEVNIGKLLATSCDILQCSLGACNAQWIRYLRAWDTTPPIQRSAPDLDATLFLL
eukprot:3979-Hanusia_phi.AAC.1